MISTKIKMVFVGVAAVAALGVGATQAVSGDDAAKSAPSCLNGNQLTTRMVVDRDTLFIEDMSGRGAVLEMAVPCSNMKDLDQISFEFSGSARICGRTDVQVVHNTPDGAIPARCIIKSYTPMTREESKAYHTALIQ